MADVREGHSAGLGELFLAVFYTGNHASFEGAQAPTDNAILRLVEPGGDASA